MRAWKSRLFAGNEENLVKKNLKITAQLWEKIEIVLKKEPEIWMLWQISFWFISHVFFESVKIHTFCVKMMKILWRKSSKSRHNFGMLYPLKAEQRNENFCRETSKKKPRKSRQNNHFFSLFSFLSGTRFFRSYPDPPCIRPGIENWRKKTRFLSSLFFGCAVEMEVKFLEC